MTLVEKLEEIINQIGTPALPTLTDVKGAIVTFFAELKSSQDDVSAFDLIVEKSALEAEAKNLKATLAAKEEEINRFRAEQEQRNERRSDDEDKIMLCLYSYDMRKWKTTAQVAKVCYIGIDLADVLLKRLENPKVNYVASAGVGWYRTDEGGEYLMRAGKLDIPF